MNPNRVTRRVFIAMMAGLLATGAAAASADDLAVGFDSPPDAAKPRVYWWWLNSLVSKEGITRDLEEYKAKGIGGVLLFDAGGVAGPMPSGPKFMSPQWREMVKHALQEANRLGLEVSINLCSGWDGGGPWITPQYSCKHVVTSTLDLQGPQRFSGKLSQPPGDAANYKDIAVQAFPTPAGKLGPRPKVTASSNQEPYPPANAADTNPESFWVSNGWHAGDAPTRQKPEWVRFDYAQPVKSKTLWLAPHVPYGPREIDVQVAEDGQTFTTVKSFAIENKPHFELALPEVTSKTFRILITASYAAENTQISEASFTGPIGDRLTATRGLKTARTSLDPLKIPIRQCVEAPLVEWKPSADDRPVLPGRIVDLTSKLQPGGLFEWDVPEGNWTIVRIGYTLTGNQVKSSSPGGGGLEVDWLNRAAMDHHFKSMAEVLLADAGPLAGKTLKYFHDDSWEVETPNWTDGFLDEFQKYRGYDARPYLPVLAGQIVGNAEVSDRFLHDYRKTIADCLTENHYRRFAELSRARGVGIHPESAGPCYPTIVPMDALRNLGCGDIPMGEFWQSHEWHEGTQNQVGKQTATAAHIYGKRYVAAEAFTSIGPHWQEGPRELKPTADIAFCEGINRFVHHTSTSTRSEDGQPGFEYFAGTHFNRNVTWWEQSGAWLNYLARCQHLLSEGLFVADVCYYNGDWAPNFVEPKHVDPSLGPGYDYDVCNAEVLLTRMSVKDGRIVLPDGMSYRVLVLPDRRRMPVEILQKIKELVAAGATVVGPKPQKDPGLRDCPRCDEVVQALAEEVWGPCDGKAVQERSFGKGRVFWGKPLREILRADGVWPDFECDGGQKDTFLDFIHRRTGEAEIYFVANRNNRWERDLSVTFCVSGKQPEIWDPVTGRRWDAPAFRQSAGRTILPLEFAPHGSLFVVFRRPVAADAQGKATKNFPSLSTRLELGGPWSVKFDPKWGGPESAQFEQLVSWTGRPEEGIRHYSGKATYSGRFDLPGDLRGKGHSLYLDLGEVKNLAEVRLNGKKLGVVWTAPFRVETTDVLKPEGNVLEIDVVNLWPNRLIGDAALPVEKRFTRTNVGVYKKDSPLMESGLLGPVTLQAGMPTAD